MVTAGVRMQTLAVVAGMALAMHGAGAQADTTARGPAIVLRADVSAREVRFAKAPGIRVTLVGGTLDSVRVVERRNLPERVQPGVTYRDVYIAVEVIGRVHAKCLAAAIEGRGAASCARGTAGMQSGAVRDTSVTRDTTRTP